MNFPLPLICAHTELDGHIARQVVRHPGAEAILLHGQGIVSTHAKIRNYFLVDPVFKIKIILIGGRGPVSQLPGIPILDLHPFVILKVAVDDIEYLDISAHGFLV